ncbi:MAG: hypothetical protein LBL49_00815 [Clostridiales Family XIII bacterium]|jgi:2-dehydropantoate 2-reductase|nr:hypothetical protein [Clostridiales Family XIII bacterium]
MPLSQVVWGFPGCGGGFEGNTLYGGLYKTIHFIKATGSKLSALTRIMSCLPPKVVGFLMSKVIFSPKSMPYALIEHNHYKVGPAVQEIISEARKYGINAPRLYAVENLITK